MSPILSIPLIVRIGSIYSDLAYPLTYYELMLMDVGHQLVQQNMPARGRQAIRTWREVGEPLLGGTIRCSFHNFPQVTFKKPNIFHNLCIIP
jgi:hypothetical protein